MKQETFIQIVSVIIVVILAFFYDPKSNIESKTIFLGIVLAVILLIFVFDIYKKIDNNERKMKMFNEKIDIYSRLIRLEEKMSILIPRKKGQIDPRILLIILILVDLPYVEG